MANAYHLFTGMSIIAKIPFDLGDLLYFRIGTNPDNISASYKAEVLSKTSQGSNQYQFTLSDGKIALPYITTPKPLSSVKIKAFTENGGITFNLTSSYTLGNSSGSGSVSDPFEYGIINMDGVYDLTDYNANLKIKVYGGDDDRTTQRQIKVINESDGSIIKSYSNFSYDPSTEFITGSLDGADWILLLLSASVTYFQVTGYSTKNKFVNGLYRYSILYDKSNMIYTNNAIQSQLGTLGTGVTESNYDQCPTKSEIPIKFNGYRVKSTSIYSTNQCIKYGDIEEDVTNLIRINIQNSCSYDIQVTANSELNTIPSSSTESIGDIPLDSNIMIRRSGSGVMTTYKMRINGILLATSYKFLTTYKVKDIFDSFIDAGGSDPGQGGYMTINVAAL